MLMVIYNWDRKFCGLIINHQIIMKHKFIKIQVKNLYLKIKIKNKSKKLKMKILTEL